VIQKARTAPAGLVLLPGDTLSARFGEAGFTLEKVGQFGPLSTWIVSVRPPR